MPTALDLFERHHLAVFRFLRGMRLPTPDAEDLTQEVFLRVLRGDGTLELSLLANRALSYVALDGSNDGGIGEGGEKLVDLRPGEAIRVELPDPSQGAPRGDPRAPRMAQDLEGHSFAVVLSARPLS